jgi:hypothetical protein
VTARTDRLLREIEAGALDEETHIVDLLRKVISVGGQMGSNELRDWAKHELQGYGSARLPHYRRISPLLKMEWGSNTKSISRLDLPPPTRRRMPKHAALNLGIAEIERFSLYEADYVQFEPSWGQDVLASARFWNHSYWHDVRRIYWEIPTDTFYDIVDHVRTALTVLVAEIRANTPAGAVTPPAKVATNAIHFAITGSRNKVTFAAPQEGSTVTVTQPDQGSRSWLRIAGAVLLGLVAVAGAIFALMQAQGWSFG